MIYFAQAGDYVKIGYTTRMDDRIPRITRRGDGADKPEAVIGIDVIDILRVIQEARVRDEMQVHALFAEWRAEGEWFRATPELLAAVKDLTFETEAKRLRRERRERAATKAAA